LKEPLLTFFSREELLSQAVMSAAAAAISKIGNISLSFPWFEALIGGGQNGFL
jgi:hypothetical protein